jgi:hypothetical protein
MRDAKLPYTFWLKVLNWTLSRTPEEGGRTLANAAKGGVETHGKYLDDCKIGN